MRLMLRAVWIAGLFFAFACGSGDSLEGGRSSGGDDDRPGMPWSDPATWGGDVPGEGSTATIPRGSKVTLDRDVCVDTLTVEGELVFADKDVSLCARWILIHGDGRLRVGSASKPYLHRATITLVSGDVNENVHGMGTKFLGVMGGGRLEMYGEPQTAPWTKLAGAVSAGARTIEVLQADGWKVGDRIVIASSTLEPNEAEVRTITAIEGTQITLDEPLAHARQGSLSTIEGRAVDTRVEIGRLTRNIVVEGDETSDAERFGGHIMVMSGGRANVDGIELRRMGQFDRLGRYPFHWHLAGDVSGQYIKNSVVNVSYQRGIVVHSVQNALVENNIVYDSMGHNYIVETPDTIDNTFRANLAVKNRVALHTHPELVPQNDSLVANYWITAARNTFEGNHAAGSESSGFWYDTTSDGPTVFRKNVGHSAAARGQGCDFCRDSGFLVQLATDDVSNILLEDSHFFENATNLWPSESAHRYRNFILGPTSGTNVVAETVGHHVEMADTLFIGSLPDRPQGGSHSAILIQYGASLALKSPIFANYPGRSLFSDNDIAAPFMSDFQISNATFVNTSGTAGLFPESSIMELEDDTFFARGYYVPASAPSMAGPDMTLTTMTDDGGDSVQVFRGPRRYSYGALQLYVDGNEVSTSGHHYVRSGGKRFESTFTRNGYLVITDGDLSYRLESAPSASEFVVVLEPESKQSSPSPSVQVALPLAQAPSRVQRTPRFVTEDDPVAGTDLIPVAGIGALAGNVNGYFYDASAGLLHLHASVQPVYVRR